MIISGLQVMESAAGFYLGHAYLENDMIRDEKAYGLWEGLPYSRESEYFSTAKEAEKYLNYVMEPDELIAEWADGTWCHQEDLEDYLSIMSDDFRMVDYDEENHG